MDSGGFYTTFLQISDILEIRVISSMKGIVSWRNLTAVVPRYDWRKEWVSFEIVGCAWERIL
jgi:hypothetical protein